MNTDSTRKFTERVEAIIEIVGGPSKLARASGLSRAVIDKYREGKSDPSRERLVAMAAAANVSVAWLATGEGPMQHLVPLSKGGSEAVNEELLGRISDGIARIYKEEGARIAPIDQGRAQARILNRLLAVYDDPEERLVGLKVMLEELRHDLRKSPADGASSSKRSA
ncbi:helix-turn-helix domain-containing protein [Dongia sp.]|uniref:helix-turn-helix domain-containing protein n=1 Tax=Dongia sp. TaxID=1977262 RepID=UPI0035AEDB91